MKDLVILSIGSILFIAFIYLSFAHLDYIGDQNCKNTWGDSYVYRMGRPSICFNKITGEIKGI